MTKKYRYLKDVIKDFGSLKNAIKKHSAYERERKKRTYNKRVKLSEEIK